MTITTEHPLHQAQVDPKDPRDLVSPEVFEKVTTHLAKKMEVTTVYAERMFGQALVFLKAYADTRKAKSKAMLLPDGTGYRVVPDVTVDPAWHAFIEHTEDYVPFCREIAGEYIHHRPVLTAEMRSGHALEHTLPALYATGYRVDPEFWSTATSCCPPCCAPPILPPLS
ncbi:hypothetical protein AB0L00_15995 [Actinoallomurus sp. NPDC052308]|uniref:hypothetical protein n=1 Tax=Actinoallomurus sp. NPDC052308 TaxID=3155530 RepID=UPI003424DBD4